MEYLEQSFHHFHDGIPGVMGMGPYSDHNLHTYPNGMAHPTSNMIGLPNPKTNETKPRLGKEEVEVLEREFQKNPKPTTQTKKKYADNMGVELARINNWFQNRRAKRKQEKKQEDFAAQQEQGALSYSEPSSPDYYNGPFGDSQFLPLQHSNTFPMTGPPQAAAPCNPQYPDPSTASMESLQRTMAAAAQASFAPQQQGFQVYSEQTDIFTPFAGPLPSTSDHAQFPSVDGPVHSHLNGDHGSNYLNTHTQDVYSNPEGIFTNSNQSLPELHASPATESSTSFQLYSNVPQGLDLSGAQLTQQFPSQLLPTRTHDGYQRTQTSNCDGQSPEDSSASTQSIGFKIDEVDLDNSSPPAPSIPFKSPPPMDIASRRKKVAVKPAALTADAIKNRPGMGPRTVSHAENLRRSSDSPMGSPMRRVMSAGGNKHVFSGRINKSGIESAQRSPINLNGFNDAASFLEHNYHSIRQPPSLTGGSSLNSSLAPPTPMSPRGFEPSQGKREITRPTSPVHGGLSFLFDQGTNDGLPHYFTPLDGDQNLQSPPETPQAQLLLQQATGNAGNSWANGNDVPDRQWSFDVSDEPLFTPAQDSFQSDLQMPQPSYLNSMSQPVTPAFGQNFNANFMFGGQESPQYKHEPSQYTLASNTEYTFPEAQYTPSLSTSPMSKQKTFQFSNQTPADFSEKK
ncbi:hypothetical protein B0O99DRAFT_591661 [Bisporella sp. PMI_857]|nr:hypothetical protein B0O99DRAFT_591661 [Bisporella sp. PMI_857]